MPGGQDFDQHAVFTAQAHFGLRQIHLHKFGCHHRRLLGHQVVGQAVGEGGLFEGEGLYAQLVHASKQPVGAALQHAVKVAIAQQQGAFVLLHSGALELQHFVCLFFSVLRSCFFVAMGLPLQRRRGSWGRSLGPWSAPWLLPCKQGGSVAGCGHGLHPGLVQTATG